MALPKDPISLGEPMDPADLADYEAEFTLETGTQIGSYTIAMMPEAALVGLAVRADMTYAPVVVNGTGGSNNTVRLWLDVDPAYREDTTYSGEGTTFGVVITATTNSVPPRRKQRTFTVTVRQR